MPNGKKRMTIAGLVPSEDYVIQVRAVDDGEGSVWSKKYDVKTVNDSAGGTRKPVTCTLTSFAVNPEGTFVATWPTVNANDDNTPMVVNRYELELSSEQGAKILAHYGATGTTQQREWSLPQIKAIFGGVIPSSVTAKLRVINSAGSEGGWSNSITVALPAPYPPTMVVPPGESVIDAIRVMWGPPAEPYVPGDARWPLGYRVYRGSTADFVPDAAQKSNMIFEGQGLETSLTTLSYSLDHYFKVVSYSAADLQSSAITIGAYRPKSPYGPDLIPPTVPVLGTVTQNTDRSVSAQANLTWTFDATVEPNKDISGFVVAWKLSSDTLWRNTYFDKGARDGVIDLPRAFANYDFKIRAYDFVGNYSNYGAVKTLDGAGLPPLALTGVDAVVRWDGMKLIWNHSESQAVVNGGRYEIQFRTTPGITGNTPVEYITGNRELDLAGLGPALSNRYWRVRPVDVEGRAGPWSAEQSETLPPFPTSSASDNQPPATAPQNVKVTGGLNYINVAWDRVSNTDPVTYEVYASTTSNFTPSGSTFVAATPATSVMVNSLTDGTPLALNTTYYVKVVATDVDTKQESHKIYSAQQSGQLTQVAGGSLGINMSGENLLYNTSFEEDNNTPTGEADYYEVFNGNPTTTPTTPSLPTNGRTGGKSQRITWTGNTSGINKGIRPSTANDDVRPNTEYTLSFYARAGTGTYPGTAAGTGFGLVFSVAPDIAATLVNQTMPVPSATVWNRYIFKWTTGATVDPNGFAITIQGHTGSGGWIEFDDIQLEAGNIASAYKTGTVSIAKLISGRMETAIMTIAAGGQILSADYNFAAKTGFLITGTGINLLGGTVNAATLAANSTITSNLYVGNTLEVATGGKVQSTNYVAGVSGYRLDSVGLDIRSGTVAAGTLAAGTITAGGIKIGTGGEIVVDSTGALRSNVFTPGSVGWKISSNGIEMWDTYSKINVAALETGTLSSAIVKVGSGGEIISDNWNPTTKLGYRLAQDGFTLYNGIIQGSAVKTDQLSSIKLDTNGLSTFSLNANGYLEVSGAYIHGNTVVQNSASNVLASANYNGNGTGWQIRGDGLATFFNVQTWGLMVYNSAKVGNSSAHSISSSSYAPNAAGWIIRGDGYAEFNGGDMRLGAMDGSGGMTWLLNSGGNGQIRFYVPGDFGHFHYIRSVGQELWINGGWGGYVHIAADNNVYVSQSLSATQNISGATLTSRNGLDVAGRGTFNEVVTNIVRGDPINDWLMHGAQYDAATTANGRIKAKTSSRRYKKNIVPLSYSTESILALEPKQFDWINPEEATGPKVGFIAEDAAALGLTDFVIYKTIAGQSMIDSFRYPEYTAALAKVVREQNQMIKSMEARLAALEASP